MDSDTAYVVDFDGTITTRDITLELALYYGGKEYLEIDKSYRIREIPIKTWLQRIAKFLPPDMRQLQNKALEWAEIRPGFNSFLKYARSRRSQVKVASDGLGFYIEPILEKYSLLGQFDFIYRNNTIVESSKRLAIYTPHAHKSCTVCGNCKAAHVVRLQEEGYTVIYIGDGSNDRFGASWSDHVCARDELAEACQIHNFSYSSWDNFYDIININRPEPGDRSANSLCFPLGSGIKS